MRGLLRTLATLLLLWSVSATAQSGPELLRAYQLSRGEERILSFVSDVTVARSGDLDVTETIRIVSLAQEIKRGIQRDFPTSYRNAAGRRTHVGFRLVSVERDGQAEPHEQMPLANGVRIRIGQADRLLPIGEHRYTIRYVTTRQIYYGDDFDELYWNATGTGWTFPIDEAEARITLPSPAAFGNRAVYTGPQGATDRHAQVVEERPGRIVFRTTRPLGREEGLTVAAAFPKGVLDAPSSSRRAAWWLEDWGPLAAAIAAILLIVGYYVRAWWVAGRGPRAGTVVPRFHPPDDLSAAAMRYIREMGIDNRAFTAAIVSLGVAGHVRITREDGGWFKSDATTLSRTGAQTPLAPEESAMRDRLFAGGSPLELKQSNHKILQAARQELESVLKAAHAGRLFLLHREWAWFGAALLPAAVLLVGLVGMLTRAEPASRFELALPLSGLAALLAGAWLLERARASSGGVRILLYAGVVVSGLFGALPTFATIGISLEHGDWPLLLPLVTLPLVLSAFVWMAAPTREGRAVLDRIEGFRHYLGITEEERLETLHPPEKTPELFERYLPYAIALEVENRWADRFAVVLATAAAAGAATGVGSWYHGDQSLWSDPGGFSDAVGSSLASTVSSAATSPSSSSGSGGGGSSGGGGGGGGGSGW